MTAISIIIPIYKVEKYLPRCLESVLAQTFADFEVICVNDGSPDGCGRILADYAKRDKRIRIITQKNQGPAMARNNGLKKAAGDFIYFLDSDDAIHPQLLEIAFGAAVENNADLVSFQFAEVKPDAVIAPRRIAAVASKITREPLYFCTKRGRWKVAVNVWSKLYRRKLIEDFPFIPVIYYEDFSHTIALMSRHPRTVLLNEALYYYTHNEAFISHVKCSVKMIQDYHAGLDFIYDAYQNAADKRELRFVVREVFPNLLKQQLNRILATPAAGQPALWKAFAEELADLDKKDCIRFAGHKIRRWLIYRKLIRRLNRERGEKPCRADRTRYTTSV